MGFALEAKAHPGHAEAKRVTILCDDLGGPGADSSCHRLAILQRHAELDLLAGDARAQTAARMAPGRQATVGLVVFILELVR